MKDEDFVAPAPLGELIDLDKKEMDQLLSLPFESLERFPEFFHAAERMNTSLNKMRLEVGLPPIEFNADDLRLIDPQIYDQNGYTKEKGINGAFFHPVLRKVFIRFPAETLNDPLEKMGTFYATSHEIAHMAMEKSGLSRMKEDEVLSFQGLNEGLADLVAKNLLTTDVLPILFPDFKAMQQKCADHESSMIDGFQITPEDIIPTSLEERFLTYSYLPQLKVVEFFKNKYPEFFRTIIECAFRGDKEGADLFLRKTFYDETVNLLSGDLESAQALELLKRHQ